MEDDEFEWDDAKAAANRRKHNITFADARRVFDDESCYIEFVGADSHSEDRYGIVGALGSRIIYVSYTERGRRIRIISARKATPYEQRKYHRN